MDAEHVITIALPSGGLGFYILVTSIIGIVMIIKYWIDRRRDSAFRRQFIDQYDISQLRSNPYKFNSIYRVVQNNDTFLRVVPIWNEGKPVIGGTVYEFDPENLVPVNRDIFIAGQ